MAEEESTESADEPQKPLQPDEKPAKTALTNTAEPGLDSTNSNTEQNVNEPVESKNGSEPPSTAQQPIVLSDDTRPELPTLASELLSYQPDRYPTFSTIARTSQITLADIGTTTIGVYNLADFIDRPFSGLLFFSTESVVDSAPSTQSTPSPTPILPVFSADSRVVLFEDGSYRFKVTDFPFISGSGSALSAVSLLSLPEQGELSLNGQPLASQQLLLPEQLPQLLFTPPANDSGANYASLQFAVADSRLVSTPHTLNINVIPVNDAPTAFLYTPSSAVNLNIPTAQAQWFFDNSYVSAVGSNTFAGASPSFTSGPNNRYTQAIEFDGTATDFAVPLDVSETDYAVSFWFRTSSEGGLLQIEGAVSTSHDRNIWVDSNGLLNARLWSLETIISPTGSRYDDGQWHHVIHTFGSSLGGQKLYVDGMEVAAGTKVSSDFTTQVELRLGYSTSGGQYLDGDIAGLSVFNQALSPAEVEDLYIRERFIDPDNFINPSNVVENSAGAVIGTLQISDVDPTNHPFGQYIFTLSDNRFTVVDGLLRLKPGISLDHENEPVINLDITATDNNGQGFSVSQAVTLLITDQNDAPVVSGQTFTLDEDATYSFKLPDFQLSDQDPGDTHTITIEAVNGGGTLYKRPVPDLELLFTEQNNPVNDPRNAVTGSFVGTSWGDETGHGGVAVFSANSDYISLAQPFTLDTEWTISTAFKNIRTDGGSWQSLVEGEGDIPLLINNSTWEIGTWENGVGFHGTGVTLNNLNSDWQTLTAIGKDGQTFFYLDNAYLGVADYQSAAQMDTIGNNGVTLNQAFAENLDDFRIYNSANIPDINFDTTPAETALSLNLDFSNSSDPVNDTTRNITGTLSGAQWENDLVKNGVIRFDNTADKIDLDQPYWLGDEWTLTAEFQNLRTDGNGFITLFEADGQFPLLVNNSTRELGVYNGDSGGGGYRFRRDFGYGFK